MAANNRHQLLHLKNFQADQLEHLITRSLRGWRLATRIAYLAGFYRIDQLDLRCCLILVEKSALVG